MVARLTPERFEALCAVDGPTIANASEQCNVRPRVSGYDIRYAFPEFGTMLGYAVACTADSTTEERPPSRSGRVALWEAVAASPKPTVVALKDGGTNRRHSYRTGEVTAAVAKRPGAIGAVSGGGQRDVNEVKELGFQYFTAQKLRERFVGY